VVQSALCYAQLHYFCEIGHILQDLLPYIRIAFVQYKSCDLSVEILEVPYRESDVAKSKCIIGWRCYYSDIYAMSVIWLAALPVGWLHISLNDYNAINVTTNKVFVQNKHQKFAIFSPFFLN
jgi:hypothetical protein